MAWEVGVLASLKAEGKSLSYVADFGLKACQLCCWNTKLYTAERAAAIRQEAADTGIAISGLWAGWPGPAKWNFNEGPRTLGLPPREYRVERVAALKAGATWAKEAGLQAIATHLGFIPEDPNDPMFAEMVETVGDIARHCKSLGLEFWFETGQETPVVLLRLIERIGTGNLGLNLDPANLILYGKASPVDSLDVFGKYVRCVHAKDGFYPTNPNELGREVKVGEGRVRFPEFVRRLKEVGFSGDLVIEREIHGEQQRQDILSTVGYLRGLVKQL